MDTRTGTTIASRGESQKGRSMKNPLISEPSRLEGDGDADAKVWNRLEYWKWWIVDEHTGRAQTTERMTREVAMRRFPKAEPVPGSDQVRGDLIAAK